MFWNFFADISLFYNGISLIIIAEDITMIPGANRQASRYHQFLVKKEEMNAAGKNGTSWGKRRDCRV